MNSTDRLFVNRRFGIFGKTGFKRTEIDASKILPQIGILFCSCSRPQNGLNPVGGEADAPSRRLLNGCSSMLYFFRSSFLLAADGADSRGNPELEMPFKLLMLAGIGFGIFAKPS